MNAPEPIIDYLRRKLKEHPAGWPELAAELSKSLPAEKSLTVISLRKIAYGDRANPGVVYVQALLDHFRRKEEKATAKGG